jgi:hypothetical protein
MMFEYPAFHEQQMALKQSSGLPPVFVCSPYLHINENKNKLAEVWTKWADAAFQGLLH